MRGSMRTMDRAAKFEKVSFWRFVDDFTDTFGINSRWLHEGRPLDAIRDIYDGIRLPRRATKYPTWHDFCSPVPFVLKPGDAIRIPTGIRIRMDEGYTLLCLPRSGRGSGVAYAMQWRTITVPAMEGIYS